VQIIIITGYLSRDPELATAGDSEVCRLNVPVKQGWGEREQTNWFRASVWGKRAKTVAEQCRKGTKVTIAGELEIGEYQGKPQYDIRVNDVDWTKMEPRTDGRSGGGRSFPRGAEGHIPGYDDDSDAIPFIRGDGVF
jgi:single-strand DNA-binding protein